MNVQVGDVVRLKVPCLGNEAGTLGVCYEVYTLMNRGGASFIFANGRYDGFAESEVYEWLDYEYHDSFVENYQFENVMQVTADFQRGFWDCVFRTAECVECGTEISWENRDGLCYECQCKLHALGIFDMDGIGWL